MKGIILAGGKGSRLYPLTLATCKQLLPIYDKPMIYYPLSILMMAKIREILLICTPHDLPRFEKLLGDGSHLGLSISYDVQEKPLGIADSFRIGKDFIQNDPVALILGDNIFHGHHLDRVVQQAKTIHQGAMIFGYEVQDPNRYGVLSFDHEGNIVDIIEKPIKPPSRFAVTGLYFYDASVVQIAETLKPSARGEYEITDVNVAYLKAGLLQCHLFDRGFAWLDTGTPDAMQKASSYVQTLQERQGVKVGCIEEVAYQMGFIDQDQLSFLADQHEPSEYGAYLRSLCELSSAFSDREQTWTDDLKLLRVNFQSP